jgi:arabinofuranosyltransferase
VEYLVAKRETIFFAIIFLFVAVINLLRANYLYTPIVDDAYIFLRYAEHIVNGYGFVWNIGEQPLEGYTSFLYLVVIIIGKLLSLNLETYCIVIGIMSSSLTLYFAYLIYQNFIPSEKNFLLENKITVIIIALSPAFLFWSGAGMDTSFYSMFLLISIYYFLKLPDSRGSVLLKGVLFGLLCVTRFEAVLFFFLALYYLMKKEKSFIKIRINKSVVLFASGFVIIFATYFIWRWSYFGYFLPNTFYAKTGGGLREIGGGFFYIIKSFRLFYGYGWIPLLFVLLFFKKNMLVGKAGFIFSFGLLSILTTIVLGGDHFNFGRFVIPVLPLLFIVFPPALKRMLSAQTKLFSIKPGYRIAVLFILLIIILIVKPAYQEAIGGISNLLIGKKEIITEYDETTEEEIIEWQQGWVLMGKALKNIANKNDYIAAIPIGAIGYYSKINVIDMVGIVDPVIAHEKYHPNLMKKWTPGHTKGDGKYVLSREPDYIQLTDYLTKKPLEKPSKRSMQFVSVKEIWASEDFHRNYEFYPVEVTKGWYYNLFKRKTRCQRIFFPNSSNLNQTKNL